MQMSGKERKKERKSDDNEQLKAAKKTADRREKNRQYCLLKGPFTRTILGHLS
jgi:hypothetical protein